MLQYLKRLNNLLGPGLTIGAAGDDPSSLGVYTQAGARFGFVMLWAAPLSYPFLAVIQEICGRIGIVTGKGLAQTVREHYPKPLLIFIVTILFITNTINIGANLGAMAEATRLVIDLPFYVLLLIFAVISLLLQVLIPYPNYSEFLRYLTLSLIGYIAVPIAIKLDWPSIINALFQPHFSLSKESFGVLLAILGTTISPYLFFWQADEEVEKKIEEGKLSATQETADPSFKASDIMKMRISTSIGMLFSNLLMFFILFAAASTLGHKELYDIHSAEQAAEVLRPIAGKATYYVFMLAVIRAGLLSVPILAGAASYAASQALGWNSSLHLRFKVAPGFYGLIILAMLIGIAINMLPIKPFSLLYYTAILNGVCALPLLLVVMTVGNNKSIMGSHHNHLISNIFGWGIIGVLSLCIAAFLSYSIGCLRYP